MVTATLNIVKTVMEMFALSVRISTICMPITQTVYSVHIRVTVVEIMKIAFHVPLMIVIYVQAHALMTCAK